MQTFFLFDRRSPYFSAASVDAVSESAARISYAKERGQNALAEVDSIFCSTDKETVTREILKLKA